MLSLRNVWNLLGFRDSYRRQVGYIETYRIYTYYQPVKVFKHGDLFLVQSNLNYLGSIGSNKVESDCNSKEKIIKYFI